MEPSEHIDEKGQNRVAMCCIPGLGIRTWPLASNTSVQPLERRESPLGTKREEKLVDLAVSMLLIPPLCPYVLSTEHSGPQGMVLSLWRVKDPFINLMQVG